MSLICYCSGNFLLLWLRICNRLIPSPPCLLFTTTPSHPTKKKESNSRNSCRVLTIIIALSFVIKNQLLWKMPSENTCQLPNKFRVANCMKCWNCYPEHYCVCLYLNHSDHLHLRTSKEEMDNIVFTQCSPHKWCMCPLDLRFLITSIKFHPPYWQQLKKGKAKH